MVHDSVRAVLSLLIPAATHLLLRLYVGRSLGEEALGLYTLTFAVYSLALIIGTFGSGAGLTRYVAQIERSDLRKARLLATAMIHSAGISVIVALTLGLIARPLSCMLFEMCSLSTFLIIGAVALPGAVTGKVVLGFLNGERRLGIYATIVIVQSLFIALCTILIVEMGQGVSGAVIGLFLPAAVTGVASVALVYRQVNFGFSPHRQHLSLSRGWLRFGFYVTLINGVGLLQGYTDTLILGVFLAGSDVGIYAAALLMLEAVRFPAAAMRMASTPRIATLWSAGEIRRLTELVNRTVGITATIVLPIAFTCMAASTVLLREFLGHSFQAAATPLILLMPGGMLMGVWTGVGALLSSTGHVRIAFRCSVISAGANVLLNLSLIPPFGLEGAALATTVSLCLGCTLQVREVQRRVGIELQWTRVALTSGLLAAIAAGILLTDSQPTTLPEVAIWWVAASVVCARILIYRESVSWFRRIKHHAA